MPSLLVLTQILSDFFQKENEKLQLKNIQSEQNLQDATKRLKNSEEDLSAVKSKLFELRENYKQVFLFFFFLYCFMNSIAGIIFKLHSRISGRRVAAARRSTETTKHLLVPRWMPSRRQCFLISLPLLYSPLVRSVSSTSITLPWLPVFEGCLRRCSVKKFLKWFM